MKKLITIFIITTILAIGLTGCSKGNEGDAKETIAIVATDNGWDSQMLHNEIAKLIVENAFDNYTFSTSTGSSTMNWQSIIAGDIDLDIESWTDNVASYKDDVSEGNIVEVGVLVPDSNQGLYVPRYVIEGDEARGIEAMAPDLKTVEDLKKYPEIFKDDEDKTKGRIYGAIPGWMADEILYKKYQFYGLNEVYNYTRLGSESTLFSSLVSAYNLGEPWVGYCYEPTWVSGKLDIVLLKDAPYDAEKYMNGECEFPSQELKIISSNKFAEKAPELVEFFSKYQTGSDLIGKALAHLDETKATHEETAKWLLNQNDNLLGQWLTTKQAEKVRAVL